MKLHDADHSTKEVYHAQIDKSELHYRFYWGMEVKGIYSPGKELNRVHPTVRSTNESDFNEYVFLNFN